MAKNSFLTGLIAGAGQGFSKRQEEERSLANAMQQIYMKAALEKATKEPEAYKATTRDQWLADKQAEEEMRRATTLAAIQERSKGGAQKIVGEDAEGNPIYADVKPLSPTMQKLKAQDTSKILEMFETNKTKSALIDEAFDVIDKVPQGVLGSLQIKGMNIAGTDPQLEAVQKVKMVLTDAQLLNTAKTKGAISDREMALFQDAAANNNFSAPRIRPVLKKLKDFMKADETAAREAYIRNYGEDIAEGVPRTVGDIAGGGQRTVGDFVPGANVDNGAMAELKRRGLI